MKLVHLGGSLTGEVQLEVHDLDGGLGGARCARELHVCELGLHDLASIARRHQVTSGQFRACSSCRPPCT